MYEKKISIFNDIDRKIFGVTYKYTVIFLVMLLIIIFTLILWKKDYYCENVISYVDNKNAIIIVSREHFNYVNKANKLWLNDGEFTYHIDKVEEREDNYILNVHFDNEIITKTPVYKVLLKKETFLEYIIRIVKGD